MIYQPPFVDSIDADAYSTVAVVVVVVIDCYGTHI